MQSQPEGDRPILAARIRVARAWANLSQVDLAEALDVSVQTIKRVELGQRPVSTDELMRVATTCHVPERFMLRGFTEAHEIAHATTKLHGTYELDVLDHLSLVNGRLDDHTRKLDRLTRKLDALNEKVAPVT